MSVSLVSGWLPPALLVLGVAGAVVLVLRRERWWRFHILPSMAVLAAVAAWVIGRFVGTQLFAEPLPLVVTGWIGLAVAAIGLAVGGMFGTRPFRKLAAVTGAAVVVVVAASQINVFYAQYPTLGDLLGVASDQEITGPPSIGPVTSTPAAPRPPGPLAMVWTPTGSSIPSDGKGRVSEIDLPGTKSGFSARPGWVYYPPAYFAANPEPLPVVVLIGGQPGEPHTWMSGERLQSIMDTFAAGHNGIAPVVIAPDALGSELANPICADSSLGLVDTYLSVDVPATISARLRVDPEHRHWVVAGFSYGGTCALQMATNHPDVYPNFVDISGQLEPTLGSRQQTVDTAFGGDEAKFKTINPVDLMTTRKFPNTSGYFVAGSDDAESAGTQQQLIALGTSAGMKVQYWLNPGSGHDWNTAFAGLAHVTPWIGQHAHITQ